MDWRKRQNIDYAIFCCYFKPFSIPNNSIKCNCDLPHKPNKRKLLHICARSIDWYFSWQIVSYIFVITIFVWRFLPSAFRLLGLYSLSGKTAYHRISWSLEATRLGVIMIVPFWNLTSNSATLLPRRLSSFRAMEKSKLESRGFEPSWDLLVRHKPLDE